jgi:HPt (histidine-containing phosphotransfer) domain-containing protein
MLRDFIDSTRQDLAALSVAFERGDTATVGHEAHRIRGASGLVGAAALADRAARIEAAARAGSLAGLDGERDELARALEQFATARGIAFVD